MAIATVNPVTGGVIREFTELSRNEIKLRLELSERVYAEWKRMSLEKRERLFMALARVLRENKQRLGELITLEMGKPIRQSVNEVEKCASVCEHYAEHAKVGLAKEQIETEGADSYVVFEPLGAILAVMPWNYPFWQVFRWAVPTLMAGNVGVLKHASNVSECALAIEDCFERAGFPNGVFQTLLIDSSSVEYVLRNNIIKGVALTGSEKAGSMVAKVTGEEIKPSVLQLGGSDPMVVLDDADLDHCCEVGTESRVLAGGRCGVSTKRFIVVEEVAENFIIALKKKFADLRVGDPMDLITDVGPLASRQILDNISRQVVAATAAGAKLACGGTRIQGAGYFYEPTVLTNVKKGMSVYAEETFGPVAVVVVVGDADEAIEVANDTRFGLGVSIWTRDMEKAQEMARKLDVGAVFVNGLVRSDPRLSIGEITKSGSGAEMGTWGLRSFVNVKSIWIA